MPMRFRDLADTFTKLELESGRLARVKILADLFTQTPADERASVVYLLQGQLRPPYEGVELGIGEKRLITILADAHGVSASAVQSRFRKAGDLGLVAADLAPASVRRPLTTEMVYDTLLDIAHTAGSGSTGGKVSRLADLLSRATAVEAMALTRIAQGRLRLGIGDQTILEAAAAGGLHDRQKKSLIERAYNVRTDLGAIVAMTYKGGTKALSRVVPRPGTPVRPALAQRLASAEAIIDRLHEVDVEPKYDGLRLQVHRNGKAVRIFSRRLEDVTAMFPDIVAAARKQLTATQVILEGEALAYDAKSKRFSSFQVTSTRRRKHQIEEMASRYPVRFFAFDVLYVNDRSYLDVPQRERHARLTKLIRDADAGTITVTDVRTIKRATDLQRYFESMLGHGLEGIMAKRPTAPYCAGMRGYEWVKLKRAYQSHLRDTVDLVIVGFLRGRGKRAKFGIGSLLAATYDPRSDRFRTVAKIGSGPSDDAWRKLYQLLRKEAVDTKPARVESRITPDVWVTPKYVVEVLADEITKSPMHTSGARKGEPGYALRFPRMLNGIRTDKGPTEATTDREIQALFKLQQR